MRKIPNLLLATIILSISNIIVRGLGFIYKIFLSNIIGEQGLGIYHIVFSETSKYPEEEKEIRFRK